MRRAYLFVAFLLLVAIITRTRLAFGAAVFAGLITTAMWALVAHAQRHVTVTRSVPERIFHGEVAEAEVTVRNGGFLPVPWLTLADRAPLDLSVPDVSSGRRRVLALAPGETKVFQYPLRGRRRGYHPVGPLEAHSGDLLGLSERRLVPVPVTHLTVFPKIVPVASLGIPTRSPRALIRSHIPLFFDPTRLAGTRPYQPGDRRRNIHWSATAKSRQLMVKQFDPAIARETVICLDLDRTHYARRTASTSTELAVTVAASLAHHVVTVEGQAAGMITRAYDPKVGDTVDMVVKPAADRSQLLRMLDLLARATAAEGQSIDRLLGEAGAHLPWGASLVIVTGSVYDGLPTHLARLSRMGFAVTLVTVHPQGSATRQDIARVAVYHVDSEVIAL